MKTIIVTIGISASGKSTWATEKVKADGGKTVRVNKDDLRSMLHADVWSKEHEAFTRAAQNAVVEAFLKDPGPSCLIIDNTHLHTSDFTFLNEMYGARAIVERKFFPVNIHEAIKRDEERPNGVGKKVIRKQWELAKQKYQVDLIDPVLKKTSPLPEPPPYNPNKYDCIICDIDGTVADMAGKRGPFDWDKVMDDTPREHVVRAVDACAKDATTTLIFVSGRDSCCYYSTAKWLLEYTPFEDFRLYMRPQGDHRRDSIVKRELYEKYIEPHYNVVAIFDDRPQVIRECWQALGFSDRIFNVGTGEEF